MPGTGALTASSSGMGSLLNLRGLSRVGRSAPPSLLTCAGDGGAGVIGVLLFGATLPRLGLSTPTALGAEAHAWL